MRRWTTRNWTGPATDPRSANLHRGRAPLQRERGGHGRHRAQRPQEAACRRLPSAQSPYWLIRRASHAPRSGSTKGSGRASTGGHGAVRFACCAAVCGGNRVVEHPASSGIESAISSSRPIAVDLTDGALSHGGRGSFDGTTFLQLVSSGLEAAGFLFHLGNRRLQLCQVGAVPPPVADGVSAPRAQQRRRAGARKAPAYRDRVHPTQPFSFAT